MQTITWIQHPTIPNRIVATNGDHHIAWITEVNIGSDRRLYHLKSYIPELNGGTPFSSLEEAKAAVAQYLRNAEIVTDASAIKAPMGYLRIADLERVRKYIKIKSIAERAGLDPQSIGTKLARGTELSVAESEAIMQALIEEGITIARSSVHND